ncbi:ABC transporter permease [Halobacteriovorax sp.]|uniref:ABC transporter permease n=1 Tax=Halobacteriovorax sp. TaxID=2020862 RepID=UPI0035664932
MFESTLLKLFLSDKGTRRFAIGVIFGFAFSIAVILGNIGIMDGFESSLRIGLKKSNGDLTIHSRYGFFDFESYLKHELEIANINTFSSIVQTEGFIIKNEISKGVMIKGIEEESFKKVTGLDLKLRNSDVILGSELAKFLKVGVGDPIVLAFANGNSQVSGLPSLKRYHVSGVVEHGIYQRDLRTLYIQRKVLQSDLGVDNRVNLISLNISDDEDEFLSDPVDYSLKIDKVIDGFKGSIGRSYVVKPYWREFSTLITAVKEEKFFISIILQIIVIISIFNVLAFVVFLNEKRSRELFLFKALGMSQKKIRQGWMYLMSIIWVASCALALLFVQGFNWGLVNLPYFKLPGDVYTLGNLSINLDLFDYSIVFLISYFWLFLISWIALVVMSKKSVLTGLRKEFA